MRPDPFDRVCLDANIVVRHFSQEQGGEVVRPILAAAERDEIEVVISSVIFLEALGQKPGGEIDEELESKVRRLLENPKLIVVDVDYYVAMTARDLRLRDAKLKTQWDAIHVATAAEAAADVFFTFDERIGLEREVRGVWLSKPYLGELANEDDLLDMID
ncbi:type II toxin-antitoxin system VapC family toxin [Gordonia terrae]